MKKLRSLFTFTILVFGFSQLSYSQEAEITGWDYGEVKYKCNIFVPYTCWGLHVYLFPTIANADNDDDPWVVDATVTNTSGEVLVEHNYFPISGPNPNVENALFIHLGNGSFEVTFTTLYNGQPYSTQTYTYSASSFQ